MFNKEKQAPPVSVVSTGFSRIKSCLSLCRPPTQPASKPYTRVLQGQQEEEQVASYSTLPNSNRGSSSVIKAYSEKVKQLELELNRLKKGLSTAKLLAGNHKIAATREAGGCLNELIRVADGSYLHEIKKISSPWKRLVMQVSPPTIVENGSTATQVIRAMASMEMDDLYSCLVESMPMGNLSGSDLSKIQKRIVMRGSEDGFTEAIVLGAMEEIEGLVMEGLRIQMSSTRTGATDTRKNEKESNKGCAVLVMLIQVRDPEEQYASVGELMVALIEVSAAEIGERKYHTEGEHIAGIKCTTMRNSKECYMWSASIEGCNCVRNPDIAITF